MLWINIMKKTLIKHVYYSSYIDIHLLDFLCLDILDLVVFAPHTSHTISSDCFCFTVSKLVCLYNFRVFNIYSLFSSYRFVLYSFRCSLWFSLHRFAPAETSSLLSSWYCFVHSLIYSLLSSRYCLFVPPANVLFRVPTFLITSHY